MTDSPGWAAPDAPGPDDPRRSPRSQDAPETGSSETPESPESQAPQTPTPQPQTPQTPAPETEDGAPTDEGADATPAAESGDGSAPASEAATPAPTGWGSPGGDASPPAAPETPDLTKTPPASDTPTGPASVTPPGWSAQQPPGATGGWGTPSGPPPASGWGPPSGGQGWGTPPGGPGWGAPQGWQGPSMPAAKPGIIPLRPLGVGELLDGAVAAMRAHWKVMIGLSLVVALLMQAIVVPVQWAMLRNVDTSVLDESNPDSDELMEALGPILGSTAIVFLIMLLGQLLITGILTLVVSRAVLGKSMTLGQAWSSATPLLPRLLGVSVMTFLIPVGLMLACLVPGILLLFVSEDLGSALLVLGFIGGAVLAIYAYILLQLSSPALILEKQTVRKALQRSRKLVTGSWWRVLGITLLIGVLTAIIGGIVQLPFSLATGFSQFGTEVPDSFVDSVIIGIGAVVSYGLTFPFGAAALALLYIDQRMRREALDLELARAAGLVPDDATPAAP